MESIVTPRQPSHDSDEQREAMLNTIRQLRYDISRLSERLFGKPLNGEPLDTNGGWCKHVDDRLDQHEETLQDTPTVSGMWKAFGIATFLLSLVMGLCSYLVWMHK